MAETAAKARTGAGSAPALPARRRFTVDEYYRMAEIGILRPDERVELLDGEVFTMAPIGSRHAGRLNFLAEWFFARLLGRAIVSVQNPVRLSSGAEPEPDLALLRPRPDHYDRAHPGPDDVLLLIEVADSSLAYDRGRKLPQYAEAGIPEVWLVDLPGNRVFLYRDPSPAGYQTIATLGRGDVLSPAAFPDLRLPVAELLP